MLKTVSCNQGRSRYKVAWTKWNTFTSGTFGIWADMIFSDQLHYLLTYSTLEYSYVQAVLNSCFPSLPQPSLCPTTKPLYSLRYIASAMSPQRPQKPGSIRLTSHFFTLYEYLLTPTKLSRKQEHRLFDSFDRWKGASVASSICSCVIKSC